MEKQEYHSDLAKESLDDVVENKHYKHHRIIKNDIEIETFEILEEHPSMNQKKGTYVELSFDSYLQSIAVSKQLTKVLHSMIKQYKHPKILLVGLGNRFLTNDSIGPRTLRDVRVTAFLDDETKKENHYYDIYAIAPGVMVQTGMESSDMIQAIVQRENIDVVIAIDALCAKSYDKLCHVIQVNNVGIYPGGGIGNHRKPINEEKLGVKVIAVGVPTVIYASSLMKQVIETTIAYFGDQLNKDNILKIGSRKKYEGTLSKKQKEAMLGHIGTLESHELEQLFKEVLTPIGSNYVFSDKQIDEQCEVLSKIISQSINQLRY